MLPAVFKERADPVGVVREMQQVADEEALGGAEVAGPQGDDVHDAAHPETDLTDGQMRAQCKMYIAALRIADRFGCDTIASSISRA